MKIRPVVAELFHADGRTGMTELLVAFRHFTNAPRNISDKPIRHRENQHIFKLMTFFLSENRAVYEIQ